MAIKVDTVTLPAYWASALVNGDTSSFDNDPVELAAFNAAVSKLAVDGWSVFDVARNDEGEAVEPHFTWSYSLYGGTAQGGDVLEYVVHKIG